MGWLKNRDKAEPTASSVAPSADLQKRTKKYIVLAGAESTTVSSWVPGQLVQVMDAKVASGEFRSRSDFTLSAIRYYVEHLDRKRRNR